MTATLVLLALVFALLVIGMLLGMIVDGAALDQGTHQQGR